MITNPPICQPVDFANSALLQMEKLTGNQTFSWSGESFKCIPNTLKIAGEQKSIGFEEDNTFRMSVRMNQFSPNIYPDLNQEITYMGVTMLIMQILKPDMIAWVLVCRVPEMGYVK